MTAQDQAVSTNYFKNKIMREEVDSKCQLCKQHEETIDRLTSGCPILAKNEYLMRHDKVGAHLHYSICKALGIEMTDKWYTHTLTPKPVCEHEDVTVLWNQGVETILVSYFSCITYKNNSFSEYIKPVCERTCEGIWTFQWNTGELLNP
jgi:hypothetical protein